jgi:two-component system chemotaxis response regulator CheB
MVRLDRPQSVAGRTRVLVVDDSGFMQRRLAEILHSTSDLLVVGYAQDGVEAIRMAEKLEPDVITMDINMAKCDGLHAIEYIMRSRPRPIVIISSYTRQGSRAALYAFEMGVVEIVEKPSNSGVSLDLAECAAEIISKVRTAARIRVVRTLQPSRNEPPRALAAKEKADAQPAISAPMAELAHGLPQIIVMGASTGGPVVLRELLQSIPHNTFPPVVIVQHLPENSPASWRASWMRFAPSAWSRRRMASACKTDAHISLPGGFTCKWMFMAPSL